MVFADAGLQLPLGLPGLILPLAATGIMLTSIHLGFKASGAAAKHPSLSGTWIASALLWLRPALYALTLASAGIKVQLPQAPVLHWVTTSSYTLGLQFGLRSPKIRQVLGYSQPGSVDSSKDTDPSVVAQAAAIDNADVLVVMGAKHAALQRYNEAMHCLQRALQLNPNSARCVCLAHGCRRSPVQLSSRSGGFVLVQATGARCHGSPRPYTAQRACCHGQLTHLCPFSVAAAVGHTTLLVRSTLCAASGPNQRPATEPALACQQTQPHRHKHCTVWVWLVTNRATMQLRWMLTMPQLQQGQVTTCSPCWRWVLLGRCSSRGNCRRQQLWLIGCCSLSGRVCVHHQWLRR
jgi:hypothetical protein